MNKFLFLIAVLIGSLSWAQGLGVGAETQTQTQTPVQPQPSVQPPIPGAVTFGSNETGTAVESTVPMEGFDDVREDIKGAIKKAHVFFVTPKEGGTVPRTFQVKMGVEGHKIRPAGEDPDDVTSGHYHLIVDGKSVKAGELLSTDGKSHLCVNDQTESTLTLRPGKHTLTLQFADGAHRSYGPRLSQTIKIRVK